jgi:phage/plasmid-like protein (TIGR03299 family)
VSAESSDWLNNNVLIGFTDKRGTAWHYRATDQGLEPNHYPGPVPLQDVVRRLFHWKPVAATVWAELEDGQVARRVPAERHKAIVRPDTGVVLGIVSPSYTVHDYRTWLLDHVASLVGEAGIGSAGLLERGGRAWVQVEVPDTAQTPEGVAFRPFLTAATSLDGRMATTYLTGAQVVVCDNTLAAAMSEEVARKFRIRHSSHSQLRVDDARSALNLLDATQASFAAHVRKQCSIDVTDAAWERFLRAHFPLKDELAYRSHPQLDRRQAVRELWRSDPRVEPWRGTAYGVLAAVNTYEHHVATGKSTRSRAERNAFRAMTGRFDVIDAKTLATLEMVR